MKFQKRILSLILIFCMMLINMTCSYADSVEYVKSDHVFVLKVDNVKTQCYTVEMNGLIVAKSYVSNEKEKEVTIKPIKDGWRSETLYNLVFNRKIKDKQGKSIIEKRLEQMFMVEVTDDETGEDINNIVKVSTVLGDNTTNNTSILPQSTNVGNIKGRLTSNNGQHAEYPSSVFLFSKNFDKNEFKYAGDMIKSEERHLLEAGVVPDNLKNKVFFSKVNENGEYTFENVPNGEYCLIFVSATVFYNRMEDKIPKETKEKLGKYLADVFYFQYGVVQGAKVEVKDIIVDNNTQEINYDFGTKGAN